jgi:hypothetical protein
MPLLLQPPIMLIEGFERYRLVSTVTYGKAQKLLAITPEPAYDQSMDHQILWIVFVVVQSIAPVVVLLLPEAHPAHFPMALVARAFPFEVAFPFAVVCLCPGLFVSTWLFYALRFPSEDGGIVALAIIVNAILWFGVFATMREIRRRSASRA